MKTYDDFNLALAPSAYKNPKWRIGQNLFNVLSEMNPDLAEIIRGTSIDPFNYSDNRIQDILMDFHTFVRDQWNTKANNAVTENKMATIKKFDQFVSGNCWATIPAASEITIQNPNYNPDDVTNLEPEYITVVTTEKFAFKIENSQTFIRIK